MTTISRKVLGIRYSLLPYYYTLFYKAHREPTANASATVWRPLFFEFPKDSATFAIDRQFMIGSSLMISPSTRPRYIMVTIHVSFIHSFIKVLHQLRLTSQRQSGMTFTLSNQ